MKRRVLHPDSAPETEHPCIESLTSAEAKLFCLTYYIAREIPASFVGLSMQVCSVSGDDTGDAKSRFREGYLGQSTRLVHVLHQHPSSRADVCPGVLGSK
jgi:hypothetical protein